MPVLPPEARLLLLAVRPPGPEQDQEIAELAALPLDWLAVGRLAEREKVLPILWDRVRPYASSLPDLTSALLSRQVSVTEFRMALTETTLHAVVRQLAAEDVRVMLLKGAALAVTVYPSFAARPMGDLDILVAPDQADRAWHCLREAGWKLELPGIEGFYNSHHHLPALLDPKGIGIVLEIHRAMMPRPGPFLLDEAEVWRDARSVRLGTTQAWVPSDQHQLLHLCIHFAWSHTLRSGLIRTVRDVATVVRRGTMDWDSFVELAIRTRARTSAYWTLAMARTLTGESAPGEVLSALHPGQRLGLARLLERAYITSGILGACPSLRVDRMFWGVGMRPRASRHGRVRPWHTEEAFDVVYHPDRKPGVGARVKAQMTLFAAWLRFAKILGSSRRII